VDASLVVAGFSVFVSGFGFDGSSGLAKEFGETGIAF